MDSLEQYLDRLASESPTPGGGSAAAVVAATGAALAAMVARISATSPKLADRRTAALEIAEEADRIRARLMSARAADEAAFAAVVEAMALPRADIEQRNERTRRLQAALVHAAEEPLGLARLCIEVLALAERALNLGNENLSSDVGCAAEFASAALAAAGYNVRINHRFIKDAAVIERQAAELRALEVGAAARLAAIRRETA